jgi:very-short-patch-repair endonuclease
VPVEISLSERTHAIEIRPRSEAPVAIESGPMDALGVASAEDWRSGAQRYFDALEGDGVTPFATESFAPVLRRAVAVLDPDGAYLPDLGERQPPVGDTLRVDDGWVLLERTRQGTQLMDDLRSLRGQVSSLEDVSELPAAVRALIESPTDAAVAEAYPALRGVSTIPGVTSSDGSGDDLFFPKPFNREQVEVIQRLSTRAGVVVQGPPGTGKTHTIANIISHYLALGKRVLVTSQKAPPLKVLREKLPEAVRPLAVSLLESDRDGLKQFQESVDIIADRVQRTRPADAARQIAALDARIEALHRGLAVIDRQIDEIGRGAMEPAVVDGAPMEPADAAPALLRAKQVLIVGDDRQVSPDAGFREEARMNLLADRHLGGQISDYRSALREEKSLYDLGTVVFAGGAIMLKEHFRCVAPIIEYSKAQFYSHQLEPLRLPSASERLDPPLVDIMVEDGYRKGKVNPPEVDCIVDAISRISDDPAMKGRSIGVTTLLGQEQAVAIQTAIEQVLGTEVMLRHDIRVGEPVAFQGDERDIMFISLVADRGSTGLSGLGYEQRFNVAASRARDRMVLVRSVELEDLRPSDRLRRSLIEHFHAPFAGDGALSADRRTRCESPFETDMYDLLVERGFRVDTQVPVGSKRIDLVVEGSDDRRLAIECDGDRYHGPEQWPDDMARQRMLERAGWVVWRCFASRFLRDRRGVIDELVEVLAARGIFPESGDALPPSRHTEHRRWRSMPLDAEHVPYAWLVLEDAG